MLKSNEAPKHYWLDWLRFAAALTVVVVHVRGALLLPFGSLPVEQRSLPVAALYLLTRIGNEAVVVFFVLSGFLVGGKAFERMADRKSTRLNSSHIQKSRMPSSA